ncbi:protein of unknown function DUF485 [Geotalea daltonii FRC-32]|uniref:DUF485 domain-containing protein n=1 Tax=Geotalea daltonii (strain DSM 22248 / JCM 15807 / FRC-32) TaxID=316067 RepID=B9M8L2_GEODF|nr:DUF485 domain-containing protein [Geotalea daltonii]ACM18547.1 protein of unknown function DUF485 [Geotalea daltonii FRC-32]
MTAIGKDWAKLANMPKFIELHSRKKSFLLTLWCIGSILFYLLPICAGYAPDFMKVKLLGRLNVTYFFCLFEFIMTWAIAIIYTHRSNTYFDPLTKEVLADINGGGQA